MKMAKLACACKPFFRTRWLGGSLSLRIPARRIRLPAMARPKTLWTDPDPCY
ncbi:BZ3500_MvSof-1268-A1-R1_Chr1-1g01124 [Microbotryum saponariae]|uniref:BZ3500_MvSof-1268-A1-R1_Chr1-1g01124 protein n=1 Tax=Microbotryum saponariae TaxID=289078 RepID=A0A2X0M538_9BASI|nr:BZ3500_MvSof-1268-A1-R1_Chr1-1g01124 [Microbotryum saponariae]SCZ93435.1 BZ3501_MvSof-1269-A2-R1_Chr1-1g00721 [Microbotryum saponariae]